MKTIRIHDLDQRGVLAFDLKDIIAKLGPKARRTFWNVSPVDGVTDGLDVTGESAAEFGFAKLAERTRQLIWGKFIGYEDPSSQNPWIVIVGDDSTWFEVQSTDEAALSRLETGFRDVRSVP